MAVVRSLTLQILSVLVVYMSFVPLSVSQNPANETFALIKFKKSLVNATRLDSTWKIETNPCDTNTRWEGVSCINGSVDRIILEEFYLSGSVNVKPLSALKYLRTFSIANNSFTGQIPDFSRLGALRGLFLDGNQFYGEIPANFFYPLRSLKKLTLQYNKFSGRIPESLGTIPNIIELRLEHNEFTGPVPVLPQTTITDISLADNKLEGEIPESMVKFGAKTFENNPGLCSAKLGKECSNGRSPEPPPGPPQGQNASPVEDKVDDEEDDDYINSNTMWIILGSVLALLMLILLCKVKSKQDELQVLENDKSVDGVHGYSLTSDGSTSSKGRGQYDYDSSSNKGSQKDTSAGELVIVNDEKGIFGLQDLMKAAAEILGNGGIGSAYKAVMANGLSVVVKRLREVNDMSREAFDAEMKRLGGLRHRNVLSPLAYHYKADEQLLVSEYIPKGSLLYLLHGDRGISHAELNWPTRLKIIAGIARGMGFLHSEFASYELPHGNLKSSNILLASDYEPLLTDYAFHPLINNTNTAQALFAYTSPEAILFQQVTPKSDVHCLGIIILEVLTGRFPSQYLNNQQGGTDVVKWTRSAIVERKELELIDPQILSATDSLDQMVKLLYIAACCTESDHHRRIDMSEAIRRIEEVQI